MESIGLNVLAAIIANAKTNEVSTLVIVIDEYLFKTSRIEHRGDFEKLTKPD